MHVVPFAHSFCAFDVVVGHIHATCIGYGAIDDHNFAVVACKDVIDPRESDGVEFVEEFPKASNRARTSTPACARSSKRLKSRLAMESLRKLKYSKWMLFLA